MELLNKFIDWCDLVGSKEAAKQMDTFPSIVERWKKKTHLPSSKILSHYHDLYMSSEPGLNLPLNRKPPEWHGKSLSILMPCYKQTNAATAWALAAVALDLGKDNVRMDMELGDAVIDNSRNKLACRFLTTDCEWSLWLDDDIVPPIGRPEWFRYMTGVPKDYPESLAAEHFVHRLMSHGKTLVGGLYFGRQKTGVPMFKEGITDKDTHLRARNLGQRDLLETEWVATGCLLVHRSVYEDIMEKYPEREVTDPKLSRNVGEFDFFRMERGKGEDVAFCELAASCGHQPYVDLGLKCYHVGYCAWGPTNTSNEVR